MAKLNSIYWVAFYSLIISSMTWIYFRKYFKNNQTYLLNSALDSNVANTTKEKWIVVTSINEPTEQIKFLANIDEFQLLVIGDRKTNMSWHWPNAIYLNIIEQETLGYKSFKTIPFNSYTRKNIGYLYAIQNGAKFIYDTDDDNKPIVNLNDYFNFKEYDYGLVFDGDAPRVLNPYAHFGQPLIWPRGRYYLNFLFLNWENRFISFLC